METNRLKQFCLIVETGSLVKAAELLHITHSALSKSMKLLQDETGLALLRPAGRGIIPTEVGLQIYQRAKDFLEQENRLFDLGKNSNLPTLKIGATEIFLLALSGQLQECSMPHSLVTLLDLDPGKIEQMIATRQLDYGITYAPLPTANIDFIEIGKFRLGCYFLKDVFAGKDIAEIPFVVPAQALSSNPLDIKERDGWLESIYPRNKKYFVNLLSTAIELTLQGLCAIYIPDFVAAKINTSRKQNAWLIEYPLQKNQKNTQHAFLLKHKDQTEDAVFKKLSQSIKKIIAF